MKELSQHFTKPKPLLIIIWRQNIIAKKSLKKGLKNYVYVLNQPMKK